MADEPSVPGPRPAGWRLAPSNSSYLRGAAGQAIEWHPWGSEPFEIARRTRRPVLLDIGASWCHWCHVMDEGTYSDPEVARLIGQHFVAVKVDRDSHPEVDRRYQRQVGALTGEGGWPLTAFLTPEGEVFLGGTYYAPTDQHGRPGFRRLLGEVSRLFREEPERVRELSGAIRDALGRRATAGSPAIAPPAEFIDRVRTALHDGFDPVNAGFGMAPKFPHPTAVSFLLWDEFANGTLLSGRRARETLERMAAGGLYDHVGGGFHRYSVDEGWHVPHFEKMAADNASLVIAYAEASQRFGISAFEGTLRGTLAWIEASLGDPRGGFGSSQDADNAPGDDGGYYTWTRAQLHAILDAEEFRILTRYFGVGSEGRMPDDPGRNVLFRLLPLAEAAEGLDLTEPAARAKLDSGLARMRAARALRPPPSVDSALYADLNGGLIRAFARAGALLGDARLLGAARASADRFLKEGYRPGKGVAHRLGPEGPSGYGLLEDQAHFAYGLVELAGASAEPQYAEAAGSLLALIDREFRGEDGLLRDIAPAIYDGAPLASLARPSYPLEDSPHLSANAAVALAFRRWASLVHDESYDSKATRLLEPIAQRISGAGLFAAGSALAAGLAATPGVSIVIEGSGDSAERLEEAARRTYHPNLWVFRGIPPPPFSVPAAGRAPEEGPQARALICTGNSCQPPITDPTELPAAITSAGRRPSA